MNRIVKIEQGLLWVFIILCAFVVGGGFYELRVVMPLWVHSPPDSVWYFESQRALNSEYIPNSGPNFWIFVTPLHLIVSLGTLAAGLFTRGPHRRWVLISSATFFLLHLSALVWFVPTVNMLFTSKASGIDPSVVVSKAHLWSWLSWVRGILGLGGFVAGLIAFRTPPDQ